MSMQTINLLMEVVLGKNDVACHQMANINIMSISEATLHHHHHCYPSPCTRGGRGKLYNLLWGVQVASSQKKIGAV